MLTIWFNMFTWAWAQLFLNFPLMVGYICILNICFIWASIIIWYIMFKVTCMLLCLSLQLNNNELKSLTKKFSTPSVFDEPQPIAIWHLSEDCSLVTKTGSKRYFMDTSYLTSLFFHSWKILLRHVYKCVIFLYLKQAHVIMTQFTK
jgi:hypothetical protein